MPIPMARFEGDWSTAPLSPCALCGVETARRTALPERTPEAQVPICHGCSMRRDPADLRAATSEQAVALRTILQGMVADAAAECRQRCTGGFLERGRHSSDCPHGYGEEAAEALALLDALEAAWVVEREG